MTFYPTSGKILGMWLAKRNQILYCIRLPVIPHRRYIILIYRRQPYITLIYRRLVFGTPIFSCLHLVSPVFCKQSAKYEVRMKQTKSNTAKFEFAYLAIIRYIR